MALSFPNIQVGPEALACELDEAGYAIIPGLLTAAQCSELSAAYDSSATQFRSRIDMARYNFGRGEYKYFNYPLPELVEELRAALYSLLAPIANSWNERLEQGHRWPATLPSFLKECHSAGQTRPTPLLLKYTAGDYNCLHQDLYGEIYFPLQIIVQLSNPDVDFEGGELMLVEQRPRMQSRGMVINTKQGDAAIIPVRERPRQGSRGFHRVAVRHGVSSVTAGQRFTLGIIFHDAK